MQTILQNVPAVIAILVAVTLCLALLLTFIGSILLGKTIDPQTMQIVNSALPVLLAFLGGAGIGGGSVAYAAMRANQLLAQSIAQSNQALAESTAAVNAVRAESLK